MSTPADGYRYAEHLANGNCPIEAGIVGKLADHECAHGRLPGDPTKRCGCWQEEGPRLIPDPAQSRDALEVANQRRARQQQIRKDISADRMTVAAALADPAMTNKLVLDVLSWQRYWGLQKAEAFLRVTKVCTPWCRAGQLTVRQRAVIARQLRIKGIAA